MSPPGPPSSECRYVTCSAAELLTEFEQFGVRRSTYEGPGSFTSYLMSQAQSEDLEMVSLVAETLSVPSLNSA